MRGYAMGAVDYVFKPVDPLILKSKVGVFVDLYNMRVQVEETSRAEQELRDANFQAELERLQIARELAGDARARGGDHPVAADRCSTWSRSRPSRGGRDFVGGDIAGDDRL